MSTEKVSNKFFIGDMKLVGDEIKKEDFEKIKNHYRSIVEKKQNGYIDSFV